MLSRDQYSKIALRISFVVLPRAEQVLGSFEIIKHRACGLIVDDRSARVEIPSLCVSEDGCYSRTSVAGSDINSRVGSLRRDNNGGRHA